MVRRGYPPEFRRRVIDLVEGGRGDPRWIERERIHPGLHRDPLAISGVGVDRSRDPADHAIDGDPTTEASAVMRSSTPIQNDAAAHPVRARVLERP